MSSSESKWPYIAIGVLCAFLMGCVLNTFYDIYYYTHYGVKVEIIDKKGQIKYVPPSDLANMQDVQQVNTYPVPQQKQQQFYSNQQAQTSVTQAPPTSQRQQAQPVTEKQERQQPSNTQNNQQPTSQPTAQNNPQPPEQTTTAPTPTPNNQQQIDEPQKSDSSSQDIKNTDK